MNLSTDFSFFSSWSAYLFYLLVLRRGSLVAAHELFCGRRPEWNNKKKSTLVDYVGVRSTGGGCEGGQCNISKFIPVSTRMARSSCFLDIKLICHLRINSGITPENRVQFGPVHKQLIKAIKGQLNKII